LPKTFIIAEIGQAHDGSLGILHSYIDAVSKTNANAIKFQTHIAEAESSPQEKFRINFSYEDKTRQEYWNRMSFELKSWIEIKEHCEDCGLEFLSSPFSIAAVDLLEEIGVDKYKIGSGEISNYLMLDKIAQTGKEVFISSGMSDFNELDLAVKRFLKSNNKINILQCTTKYPTSYEDIGLNVIKELEAKYPKYNIGLSDHSGSIYPSLAATTLGASVIEVHVVFDKQMFGPDSSSSITIQELSSLCDGVEAINTMLDFPINKNVLRSTSSLKSNFAKSLSINSSVRKGEILTLDMLESKKPGGQGISASEYENILGKKFIRDLDKWAFLNKKDVE